MTTVNSKMSLRLVRAKCLDCSESAKYVTWCPEDGIHSNRCELWPFRFGTTPDTIKRRYGPGLVTPSMMPSADVNLDDLPADMRGAAAHLQGGKLPERTPASEAAMERVRRMNEARAMKAAVVA